MSSEPSRAVVARVRAAVDSLPGNVVVVGDVMLDHYVDGSSTRLSPEAPVPVVEVSDEIDRVGGAANVAAGLASLGVRVRLVGVVGDDPAGARLHDLLSKQSGVDARLLVDPTRPTTTKQRIRVDGRHVLRVDREVTDALPAAMQQEVVRLVQDAIADAAVLVVSDYAKGVVVPGLLDQLVDRPCTIVDPKHPDIERYRGAQVLAPNRTEAIAATTDGRTSVSLEASVLGLLARLPGTAIVVTCGADGVVWSAQPGEGPDGLERFPSLARHVEDVTGAGDSVICGLAAALATGADLATAILVASAVAAAAVESPGTAAPTWDQVEAVLADQPS